MSTTRIFAYGTLMEGFNNNRVLPEPRRVIEAYMPGLLYEAGIPFLDAHEKPLMVGSPSYAFDMQQQEARDIRMSRKLDDSLPMVKGQVFEFDGLILGEQALRRADRLEGWRLPEDTFEWHSIRDQTDWYGYRRILTRAWDAEHPEWGPMKVWCYACSGRSLAADAEADKNAAWGTKLIPDGDFRAHDRREQEARDRQFNAKR